MLKLCINVYFCCECLLYQCRLCSRRVPRLDLTISEPLPETVHRSNRLHFNQRDQLRASYQNRFQRLGELAHANSASHHLDQMQADGSNMAPTSGQQSGEPMGSEATITTSTQRRRHRAQHNSRRRVHHHSGHHNPHRNNHNDDNIVDSAEPTQ